MNQSNYIPYLKIILSCCLLFPLTLVTPPLSWVRWIFWERSTPSPSNCSWLLEHLLQLLQLLGVSFTSLLGGIAAGSLEIELLACGFTMEQKLCYVQQLMGRLTMVFCQANFLTYQPSALKPGTLWKYHNYLMVVRYLRNMKVFILFIDYNFRLSSIWSLMDQPLRLRSTINLDLSRMSRYLLVMTGMMLPLGRWKIW